MRTLLLELERGLSNLPQNLLSRSKISPNAIGQCSDCKDTIILHWDYFQRYWEGQPSRFSIRKDGMFHKCGGRLLVWYAN